MLFLEQEMDTSTSSGELMFHIFGALAQFERSLIKERVNAGLVADKKRGRVGGRPSNANVLSENLTKSPSLKQEIYS